MHASDDFLIKKAHNTDMLTIVFRVVLMYLLVLFLYRLMGKRQLGQMQPFELVLTLIVADLVTIPMAEISVPIMHGIIPLFTLVFLHFLLTFLSSKSSHFSHFLSGKPVIVINPNGIDLKSLKNLNMSIDDVFEAIRGCGYFSIDQIQYAIMETNGKMTVLPKTEYAPVTTQDLKLKVEESLLPVSVISEGKIMQQNLSILKMEERDIQDVLEMAKLKKVKEVLVMTIDKSGKVFLQPYGKSGQTFKLSQKKVT